MAKLQAHVEKALRNKLAVLAASGTAQRLNFLPVARVSFGDFTSEPTVHVYHKTTPYLACLDGSLWKRADKPVSEEQGFRCKTAAHSMATKTVAGLAFDQRTGARYMVSDSGKVIVSELYTQVADAPFHLPPVVGLF